MTLEVEGPGEIQRGEQSSGPIMFDAEVVAGFRYANWALKYQLPKIEPRFSEIRGCHPGSINLRLDKGLRFNSPDYTTPQSRGTRRIHEWSSDLALYGFNLSIGGMG